MEPPRHFLAETLVNQVQENTVRSQIVLHNLIVGLCKWFTFHLKITHGTLVVSLQKPLTISGDTIQKTATNPETP